jgi:gliding motility-associated-like protein
MQKMKRLSVLLSIVAASFSVVAQDIEIEGNLCIDENLIFKCSNLPARYDSFLWDFGDGSTSTDKEPSHSFPAGSYTIAFSSKSNGVDEITTSKTITINALPKTDFDVDSTSQRNTKTFNAKTVDSNYSYSWVFGDGAESTDSNPQHAYSAPGIYNVTLTVTDNQNCTDTTMKSITIDPSSKVPNVFTPNGDGLNDCFMISGNGARLKLEIFNRWGYKMFSRTGTENIVWDGYNPQGTLVSPGTYFYVITVEEGSTSYDPLNGYITVYY